MNSEKISIDEFSPSNVAALFEQCFDSDCTYTDFQVCAILCFVVANGVKFSRDGIFTYLDDAIQEAEQVGSRELVDSCVPILAAYRGKRNAVVQKEVGSQASAELSAGAASINAPSVVLDLSSFSLALDEVAIFAYDEGEFENLYACHSESDDGKKISRVIFADFVATLTKGSDRRTTAKGKVPDGVWTELRKYVIGQELKLFQLVEGYRAHYMKEVIKFPALAQLTDICPRDKYIFDASDHQFDLTYAPFITVQGPQWRCPLPRELIKTFDIAGKKLQIDFKSYARAVACMTSGSGAIYSAREFTVGKNIYKFTNGNLFDNEVGTGAMETFLENVIRNWNEGNHPLVHFGSKLIAPFAFSSGMTEIDALNAQRVMRTKTILDTAYYKSERLFMEVRNGVVIPFDHHKYKYATILTIIKAMKPASVVWILVESNSKRPLPMVYGNLVEMKIPYTVVGINCTDSVFQAVGVNDFDGFRSIVRDYPKPLFVVDVGQHDAYGDPAGNAKLHEIMAKMIGPLSDGETHVIANINMTSRLQDGFKKIEHVQVSDGSYSVGNSHSCEGLSIFSQYGNCTVIHGPKTNERVGKLLECSLKRGCTTSDPVIFPGSQFIVPMKLSGAPIVESVHSGEESVYCVR